MVNRDRADGWQFLVRLRGEVVPNVLGNGICREGTARVGLEQRDRDAKFAREEVAIKEIIGEDDLLDFLLEIFGLGRRPVLSPAVQIAGTGAAARIDSHCGRRNFTRVAAGAPFGKDLLAPGELREIFGEVRLASGSIFNLWGEAVFRKNSARSGVSDSVASQ